MRNILSLAIFTISLLLLAFVPSSGSGNRSTDRDTILYPEESHFKNVQQLTFGGDNAEAYWSPDGKYLVFQRTMVKENVACDQIFMGKVPERGEEFTYKMISSGKGRTTCAFFTGDNKQIVYASTHKGSEDCPPLPDRAKYGNRYIWPVYDSYELFISDTSGKNLKQLTNSPGYDAEATISPDGEKMIFTSTRNGDLDLYVLHLKTGALQQLTNTLGYDGGAWFSRDGKKIVWRASRPEGDAEQKEYKELLREGLVAPTRMEVWTANADGSGAKQVTRLGQANWAPNFMPDGRIIFCSNHEYKRGFPFNMYTMNADGSGLEKISRDLGFDAFPMFSPDGKKVVFSSNRNNGGTRETNIFIADWVD